MAFQRSFITIKSEEAQAQPVKDGMKLRVMSFNVLAQGLTEGSFIKCPSEALQFPRRFEALMEEITAFSADIIFLQEVDMYAQINDRLSNLGYSGVWKAKPESPALNFEHNIGPDGSAIFYKLESFPSIGSSDTGSIGETGQVIVSQNVTLPNGQRLVLICLHLKAKSHNTEIRERQGRWVLDYVEKHKDKVDSVVIAGDLNSVSTEPVHDMIKGAGFQSTYVTVCGAEPAYTTCKIRMKDGEDDKQCYTGDYIYYRNNTDKKTLTVRQVLEIPDESALGVGRLPSLQFPSDHLPMVTDFYVT